MYRVCVRPSLTAARFVAAEQQQPTLRKLPKKTYKELHPKSEPHQQGRRKPGKPSVRYTGQDAEFTESSDDDGDGEEGNKSRRAVNPLARPKGAGAAAAASAAAAFAVKKELDSSEEEDGDNTAAIAAEAEAVAAAVASRGGRGGGGRGSRACSGTTSEAMARSTADGSGDGGGRKGKGRGKRSGGDTSRQGKRARVVDVAEGGRGSGRLCGRCVVSCGTSFSHSGNT